MLYPFPHRFGAFKFAEGAFSCMYQSQGRVVEKIVNHIHLSNSNTPTNIQMAYSLFSNYENLMTFLNLYTIDHYLVTLYAEID